MKKPDTYDYILIRKGWYLHQNDKDATNAIAQARGFGTWEEADRRARDTNWQYCQVKDLNE